MFYWTQYHFPAGTIILTAAEKGITSLRFEGHGEDRPAIPLEIFIRKDDFPPLTVARKWLDSYFAGNPPDIPDRLLAPAGTPFQQMIWEITGEIPYGETRSYGAVAQAAAERLGRKMIPAQAAGGALSRNPLPLFIPCHRVVGADGSLTGFSSGIELKKFLLDRERKFRVLHDWKI